MQNSYLVTYDIADAKRLRQVFKTMKNWGNHIQFSVFECQLTKIDLLECRLLARLLMQEIRTYPTFVTR